MPDNRPYYQGQNSQNSHEDHFREHISHPPKIENYLVLNIVSLSIGVSLFFASCCCFPFVILGIVGLLYSLSSQKKGENRNLDEALKEASLAKIFGSINIVLEIISIISVIIIMLFGLYNLWQNEF